ncbi:hypothetical protein [Haloarchaeobius sp. DT45]|uniref:hypothetical protein n=1 Tax=Haloarchaeobius sp. DT45 TaxID=3446116 RepID=UPI003F6A6A6C
MSYDIQRNSAGPFNTTVSTVFDEQEDALLGVHYDSESVIERWPQLARGYGENDFTMVRATVAGEWDSIDHEDLHVDPEDILHGE